MNYKILFLIFTLFFINNVSGTIIPITNDAQVNSYFTDDNHCCDSVGLLGYDTYWGAETQLYFEIPTTPKQYVIVTSDNPDNQASVYMSEYSSSNDRPYYDTDTSTFYFECQHINTCGGMYIYTSKTTIFNQSTLTWNNKPAIGDLIASGYYGYYDPSDGNLWIGITITTETEIFLSGYVNFKDENINSSTYPLSNAMVFINSSYYNYTDADGKYFINISDGVYPVTISKIGFGTITGSIDTSLSNNDFTLLFSHPLMTLPHIETGNKILSEYSNTQYPTSIWNSPNFVWGVYRFIEFDGTDKDIDYFKPCSLYTGNNFSCELVTNKDYKFRIIYSDIYNYNLNTYHPFLTGSRNFTTGQITIGSDYTELTNIKTISILPQKERESAFKDYFWEAIYVMMIILVLGLIFSSGKKHE